MSSTHTARHTRIVLAVLQAIGRADDVGLWRVSHLPSAHIGVEAWSRRTVDVEAAALELAETILGELVPPTYRIVGDPQSGAVEAMNGLWRGHVALEVSSPESRPRLR